MRLTSRGKQGANLLFLGKSLGEEIEAEFFRKAEEEGFSEEEAKNAFNNNMMTTGLLSEAPAEFAKESNRKWLVSDYTAGDVVIHDPFAVSCCQNLVSTLWRFCG